MTHEPIDVRACTTATLDERESVDCPATSLLLEQADRTTTAEQVCCTSYTSVIYHCDLVHYLAVLKTRFLF
jgi:hypothetical protein